MAVKDFVGTTQSIQQDLVFDFKDFYKMLKKYLKDLGYAGAETEYHEGNLPTGERVITFSLEYGKKADDYTKLNISIGASISMKDVEIEKEEKTQKAQKGKVNLSISSYIKRDLEDDWKFQKTSAFRAFIREVYDKFLNKNKMDEYASELKKDQEHLVHDLKTFLKLKRLD